MRVEIWAPAEGDPSRLCQQWVSDVDGASWLAVPLGTVVHYDDQVNRALGQDAARLHGVVERVEVRLCGGDSGVLVVLKRVEPGVVESPEPEPIEDPPPQQPKFITCRGSKKPGESWPFDFVTLRTLEGFRGFDRDTISWQVYVNPSTPAAEFMRAYFNGDQHA